jgi:hypothetical protein
VLPRPAREAPLVASTRHVFSVAWEFLVLYYVLYARFVDIVVPPTESKALGFRGPLVTLALLVFPHFHVHVSIALLVIISRRGAARVSA